MAAFLKISICLSALLPIEQSAWSKGLTGIMLTKFLEKHFIDDEFVIVKLHVYGLNIK